MLQRLDPPSALVSPYLLEHLRSIHRHALGPLGVEEVAQRAQGRKPSTDTRLKRARSLRELGINPRAKARRHEAHEGHERLVLSQGRCLRLQGRLTLSIENCLLLLLLRSTSAAQGLDAGELTRLGLLPKAAQEAAVAGACAQLLRALLAVESAKSLLRTCQLACRAERGLTGAHPGPGSDLAEAKDRLPSARTGGVALPCGLAKLASEGGLSAKLGPGETSQLACRRTLLLLLASELAHGTLLGLLEAAGAQCADSLP